MAITNALGLVIRNAKAGVKALQEIPLKKHLKFLLKESFAIFKKFSV